MSPEQEKRQMELTAKSKLHLQGSGKVKIKIKGRIQNRSSTEMGDNMVLDQSIKDKEAIHAAEDKILNQIKVSQKKYQLRE